MLGDQSLGLDFLIKGMHGTKPLEHSSTLTKQGSP